MTIENLKKCPRQRLKNNCRSTERQKEITLSSPGGGRYHIPSSCPWGSRGSGTTCTHSWRSEETLNTDWHTLTNCKVREDGSHRVERGEGLTARYTGGGPDTGLGALTLTREHHKVIYPAPLGLPLQ